MKEVLEVQEPLVEPVLAGEPVGVAGKRAGPIAARLTLLGQRHVPGRPVDAAPLDAVFRGTETRDERRV